LASRRCAAGWFFESVVWLERGEIVSTPNQECPPRFTINEEEAISMSTTMIGIDPHKATHTAVAVNESEVVLGEFRVRASPGQVERLREWAVAFGDREWAVESAGGLGYLLSQQLVAAGETVFDVAPMLASRVRLLGSGRSQKNDPNDARSVAIAALRSDCLAPVVGEDHTQVLRMLAKRHRDMSRARAKRCSRLHAVLIELRPGGVATKMSVNKAKLFLEAVIVTGVVVGHRVEIAAELIAEIGVLDESLKASKKRVAAAVAVSGTTVTDIMGVGPICAAIIVGHVANIDRFPSKGHFAAYNATAPIEASSGDNARHRLNPRGNRQLNYAMHTAAVNQIRRQTQGRVYYDRKRAEGKNPKEALRCLKRRISDAVYKRLVADAQQRATN
jgi:transposase